MRWTTCAAVLLFACAPTVDDTGAPTDPAPPHSDPQAPAVPLVGTIGASARTDPPDGIQVGLVAVDVRDGLVVGAPWISTGVALAPGGEADFLLELPAWPGEAHLEPPDTDPDLRVGHWMLAAWAGEVPVGASAELIAYVEGDTSGDVEDLGGTEGYNLVRFGFDSQPAEMVPVEEVGLLRLRANLLHHDRVDLAGTVAPDPPGRFDVSLHALPEALGGQAPADRTLAVAPGGSRFTFAGPLPEPPEDHLVRGALGLADADVGAWVALAYRDEGTWGYGETDDQLLASSLATEDRGTAVLLVRPRSLRAGFLLDLTGLAGGWNLAAPGDLPLPVSWDDGLLLDDAFSD